MHAVRTSTHTAPAALCFLLCCLLCGCGMFEQSCEETGAELSALYDDFLDGTTDLGEDAILERCAAAKQRCPDLSIAWELAGLMHWEKDDMKEALDCYKKALALKPADQELLEDAVLVAFLARRDYLYLDGSGKVRTQSFAKIPLEQYAQIAPEARLLWCEDALDKWVQTGTKTEDIKNRQGEIIGETSVSFRSSIREPRELDFALLSIAKARPETKLFKATSEQLMRHTSSDIATELY